MDSAQKPRKLCVLVVEDNDLLRETFKLALRGEHLVFAAKGVNEGWIQYKEKRPDIIFMDICLPDGSGHELTKKIKEDDPQTCVVMATVNDVIEDKEMAAHNHADGFIAKPFSKNEINDFIDRCLMLKSRKA